MYTTMILGAIAGLSLFLYGMQLMGDGLQKVAGEGLKGIIRKLTKNRFMSVLVGMFVTTIIQSSSATTVMVVGFVNAGLMTLAQAVGVVFGANVGTTITGQMVSFNLSQWAPIVIASGLVANMLTKNPKVKEIVAKIKATYEDYKTTLDDPKKAKKEPKHLGFEPETDDNGDETGNLIFKFKAKASFINKKGERVEKAAPAVFDAQCKQIKEPIAIYNGTTMIVNFSPSGYFNGTNNGVTLYLNAVQIINLVSGGNGDAKDFGFGEEEGYSSTPSMEEDADEAEDEVNDEDF